MWRLDGSRRFIIPIPRLFLETGDNVQLVFSGRVRRAGEQVVPLDPQEPSDVLVRSARIAESGLEIEIAHFGRHVPDEASAICGANDSENAPWTLVRIDSLIEPVSIAEMARAFCSVIPAPD